MNRFTIAVTAAAGTVLAFGGAAFAESRLAIVMGGEAYDGPPRFEVLFDGQTLGEGVVETAIDTATAGRFADATVKAPYLQTFEFAIPDAVFNAGGEVRIRFLNEAYGGDGSNRDRNLYVATVAINGVEVPARAMITRSAAGIEPSAILGDFLVIFDGTADAIVRAPDSGWPAEGVEVAVAEPVPEPVVEPEPEPVAEAPTPEPELEPIAEPAAPEPEPVETAAVPEPVETAPLEVVPEPLETVPLEVAAEPEPAAEAPAAEAPAASSVPDPEPEPAPSDAPPAAEVAAVTPDPASGTDTCVLDNRYNVLGFNENSNDLTPRVIERLDQIIADIGDNVCKLQLTGYSSTQGDFATNALFSVERAQNVLRYLRDNGLRYTSSEAVGAGETDQFGPAFSDNRRVVILAAP